ncbi:MAG TPA: chemotaxis protein CheD [Roseiflexaceae bacterium]|nr:chemotaxis protein CheD [Roseiflexaceae bacterium]
MPDNIRMVLIGELVVSSDRSETLAVHGLGSCVVVAMYDPRLRIGGMLHCLLPADPWGSGGAKPTRFVESGVPLLVAALARSGAAPDRLHAYLCGGAQVVAVPGRHDEANVGRRNVEAAEAALRAARVPLRARSTGGTRGLSVKLEIASGRLTIKTIGQAEQLLAPV